MVYIIIVLWLVIFFFAIILAICDIISRIMELRRLAEENKQISKRNLELKKQIETLTPIVEDIYRINSEHLPGHHDGFNHGDRYL